MNGINPIQMQKFLGGVDYPASKEDLLMRARENGAPQDVLDELETLPEDETFETPADVNELLAS
jgi:hypothetical protein